MNYVLSLAFFSLSLMRSGAELVCLNLPLSSPVITFFFFTSCTTSSSANSCATPHLCGLCLELRPQTSAYLLNTPQTVKAKERQRISFSASIHSIVILFSHQLGASLAFFLVSNVFH